MSGSVYDRVFDIAADQFGFISTTQARTAGINPQTLLMMERRGAVRRTSRGVYRLVNFPETQFDAFMGAVLWPVPLMGVLSHESALALYQLSDVNPAKLHITVPFSFRTRRLVPRQLSLHFAALKESEITRFEGIPVTSVVRTILDCHDATVGNALVGQAIEEAQVGGLLSRSAAAELRKLLG